MRRLKIVAAQAAIAGLLFEVCLRVYNPRPFRVRGERIILPVHQQYTFYNDRATKLDPVTHHTKNSLGFRGPEPPRDFEKHLTILTIGGSTTECLFLSDGHTWTDVVGRKLSAAIPDVWVNNAGLDGQSTYGHLILLRSFISSLRPKVALFLVGANDVGLDRSNPYDTALVPHRSWFRQAGVFFVDRSEVLGLAQNLVRVARATQAGFGHSQVDLRSARALALDSDRIDRTLGQYAPTLDGYQRRLEAIVDVCRTSGIDPVFVTQPALFGDAVDPVTGVNLAVVQVNGRGNGTLEWRLLETYNDITRRVCGDKRVFLIDLGRELPKDSRLFYDFLHFTNEGAVRVGEIVAGHLEAYLRHR